jgi:hypothetical protein
MNETSSPLDAPDTIPRHKSRKVRAAAIVFSYDYGEIKKWWPIIKAAGIKAY